MSATNSGQATSNEINQILGASERETAFLDYLSPASVAALADAIRNTKQAQSRALDEAIEQGVERLPTGVRSIADGILK